jgi:hypothetical protein
VTHSDTMRVLAERYLALAKTSDDSEERRKFLGYAAAYADLAKQTEEPQLGGKLAPERGEASPGLGPDEASC